MRNRILQEIYHEHNNYVCKIVIQWLYKYTKIDSYKLAVNYKCVFILQTYGQPYGFMRNAVELKTNFIDIL